MLEYLFRRFGKKSRAYIIMAVVLIILNIIIEIITYQTKIRFSIEGQRFKFISHTDNMILFQDHVGSKVTVIIDSDIHTGGPYSIGNKYEVQYKDKVIKCDNSDWLNKGEIITLSNGKEYVQEPFFVTAFNDREDKSSLPFDVQLVNHIKDVYNFTNGGSIFLSLIYTVPLILFGLFSLIYPEKVWGLKHMLDVSGGEPTDWAISTNIIGGVILIALGLLIPVIIVNQ